MPSCMHNGHGCSPQGTALYKCAGYFECSFACENYVCDSHVHRTRYGTFCANCDPAPPVFDMPRAARKMNLLAGQAANAAASQAVIAQR